MKVKKIKPTFLVDDNDERKSVILPISDYNAMIDALKYYQAMVFHKCHCSICTPIDTPTLERLKTLPDPIVAYTPGMNQDEI